MSKNPLLTIGMAHFADYHGLYFTIQSIRVNNPHLMDRIQFVVIDNSPTDPAADAVKDLIRNCHGQAKYIPMSGPVGTSPSRNEIFAHADGDYVLAMDCHVLLWPGAIEALLLYYEQNPNCNDLIHGPMFYDGLHTFSTHFNNVWRSEMWGVWSTAWICKCGKTTFTMAETREGAVPSTLDMKMEPMPQCPQCNKLMPVMAWAGHERHYEALGFKRIGPNDGDKPFEIPGQGLGLFSCRREAWLGFHPSARGFGGEELYIHEKYRQAGHKAICLPALKWLHRFGRPEGVKYPLTRWFKIRNYVLEFDELGLDKQPIYDHFVPTNLMSQKGWDTLTSNPIALETEPANSGCTTCGGAPTQALPSYDTIDDLFNDIAAKPRDLNEHMGSFRKYASLVEKVTEFTARRESTIGFLSGKPKLLTSYSTESDGHVAKALQLVKETTVWARPPFTMGQIFPRIEPTDLLFIDTKHSYAHLKAELTNYAPHTSRFIIMHDTVIFGMQGDDNGPGLMQAIVEFMELNPQWEIIRQENHQHGLTILGCRDEDRPQGPGTELKKILSSLGINPPPTCDCFQRMTQMNDWGVEGCRANLDTIITWMKDGQVKWGWQQKLVAGTLAVITGLAFKINPLDPFPGVIANAISKAEKNVVTSDETKGSV